MIRIADIREDFRQSCALPELEIPLSETNLVNLLTPKQRRTITALLEARSYLLGLDRPITEGLPEMAASGSKLLFDINLLYAPTTSFHFGEWLPLFQQGRIDLWSPAPDWGTTESMQRAEALATDFANTFRVPSPALVPSSDPPTSDYAYVIPRVSPDHEPTAFDHLPQVLPWLAPTIHTNMDRKWIEHFRKLPFIGQTSLYWNPVEVLVNEFTGSPGLLTLRYWDPWQDLPHLRDSRLPPVILTDSKSKGEPYRPPTYPKAIASLDVIDCQARDGDSATSGFWQSPAWRAVASGRDIAYTRISLGYDQWLTESNHQRQTRTIYPLQETLKLLRETLGPVPYLWTPDLSRVAPVTPSA